MQMLTVHYLPKLVHAAFPRVQSLKSLSVGRGLSQAHKDSRDKDLALTPSPPLQCFPSIYSLELRGVEVESRC